MESAAKAGHMLGESENSRSRMQSYGRQSEEKLQTACSLKIFQAEAHNQQMKTLKSIEGRSFVEARVIWGAAKWTALVLPEKGSFRRHV